MHDSPASLSDHLARLPGVEVLYTDLDNTLLGPAGSLLTGADGRPSAAAAQALVAAAQAGMAIVPVTGRGRAQMMSDTRLLGLSDFIAEVGAVIVRGGETFYEWGQCPRDLAENPHDAMVAARAVEALLDAFAADLRHYEPWHRNREGGHLFHGLVDVEEADVVLAEAGCEWAYLCDNGATGGWTGREVRAYHLLPRGVGKAKAVADDLIIRGLGASQAAGIGDSLEDRTIATSVGTYLQVSNGHGPTGGNIFGVRGAMGAGFAEAVAALLGARAAR